MSEQNEAIVAALSTLGRIPSEQVCEICDASCKRGGGGWEREREVCKSNTTYESQKMVTMAAGL